MTVIKRNGTEVPFDINKIIAAITKANGSVGEDSRMTALQIRRIAESVELACRKRGWILSGARPDTERAASLILDEFRSGKMGRITMETPPREEESHAQGD